MKLSTKLCAILTVVVGMGTLVLVFFLKSTEEYNSTYRIRPTIENGLAPDGSRLALLVGPSERNSSVYADWNTDKSQLYILHLKDCKIFKVEDSKGAYPLDLCWRNVDNSYELCFKGKRKLIGPRRMLQITDRGVRELWKAKLPRIDCFLSWSPDGKLLAGAYTDDDEKYCFGVWDLTENKFMTMQDVHINRIPPVWADVTTIFIYERIGRAKGGDHMRILKIVIQNDTLILSEVVAQHEGKHYLRGSIEGKCVYHLGNELFVGKNKVYSGEIGALFVDGGNIALETGSKIRIIDQTGHTCSELEKAKNERLFGFDNKTQMLYIMENFKKIIRFNLQNPEERSVIFEADYIEEE